MADGTTHRGTGEVADSSWRSRLKQVGPGVMAADTGVGAGDLVATLVAGARYGYLLFWAVVLGTGTPTDSAPESGSTGEREPSGTAWEGELVSVRP